MFLFVKANWCGLEEILPFSEGKVIVKGWTSSLPQALAATMWIEGQWVTKNAEKKLVSCEFKIYWIIL